MERLLKRLLQRLLIIGLGVVSVWLIVFVVFRFADHRSALDVWRWPSHTVSRPMSFSRVLFTWASRSCSAGMCRATRLTGDGLPGDPVNLVLIGTLQQLRSAFATAGWSQADRLGLASSWRMIVAFVRNSPYPTAPFSTLYLFGRGQDIGFQKAIDDSPRKRHHIRFWALAIAHAEETVGTAAFWLNTDRPPEDARVLWVGAGTRDTGISLTRLTFQVTHATDDGYERRAGLHRRRVEQNRVIEDVISYEAGQHLPVGRVNHYITDGEVSVANLMVEAD